LYSFGVLLYEMLTGEVPVHGGTVKELIEQSTYGAPMPPRKINPGIPEPLERTILALMAKDPGSRPRSARAVLEKLKQIGSLAPVYEDRLSKERA
jgi:serine/threonine-protein kinase